MTDEKPVTLSVNEGLKSGSNHLRGTLADSLTQDLTGAISDGDAQLIKFHGMYLQDDRDLRPERAGKKLDKAHSFMIRLRLPAGVCSPQQWLQLDSIADDYGNGTLRLTTRQTFQFHGIIKRNLKATLQAIDKALLDTLAACGDVNRTVMGAPVPEISALHAAAYDLAKDLSDYFLPQTGAYREIWLDGEKISPEVPEHEPIYGSTYLPRKFKIGIAVPPHNDVDVFTQDLGFTAVADANNTLLGWNVSVGGGMGTTHGDPQTYARAADWLCFCLPHQARAVAEAVITTQRDNGNRVTRKLARTKYTIDTMGLAAFRAEVEKRFGEALPNAKPVHFDHNSDRYGRITGDDGLGYQTLFIENGRLTPALRAGVLALAQLLQQHGGHFRLTPNQNLMLAAVPLPVWPQIDALIAQHNLQQNASPVRRNSMACVSLPTCALALAESERYLPSFIDAFEQVLAQQGLAEQDITLRMTGCPNGCARPFVAEIALVGRAPERYNVLLGGSATGHRVNTLYAENLNQNEIFAALTPLLSRYASERIPNERFGNFVHRAGIVSVARGA